MKSWGVIDTAEWSVRNRQSLKSAFVATHFALAAREAEQTGSLVSFYYLSYYAVLHALWGVLYIHPNESTHAIAKPTHSKLPNVFQSAFCGTTGIIRYPIKKMMGDLKLRREYYSYRMPMNSPFDDEADARGATSSVGGIVKQCIQLANLHSHILSEASKREGVNIARLSNTNNDAFIEVFRKFNSQRHPSRKGWFLEPADEAALHEMINSGCGLNGHSIEFEHMSDNFMTYPDNGASDLAKTEEVNGLVYNALF